MSIFYICVPYYSLPEFPKSCALVKNHKILPRDVLLCNRTNTVHINGGMQYDPNIENGEYRICEPPVRRSLKKKAGYFDELYLLFRTRFIQLDNARSYLVTGFYKIKKEFDKEESEGPIIYAENMKFVSITDSVDITRRIIESRAFRPSFSSQNAKWGKMLTDWVKHFEKKEDETDTYIHEINRFKKIFEKNEFGGGHYSTCTACQHNKTTRSSCPLVWRLNACQQMPQNPAHYMQSLDQYYRSLTSRYEV